MQLPQSNAELTDEPVAIKNSLSLITLYQT